MTIDDVMSLAPVMPVLVIENPAFARPLAEALVRGGLVALEVMLRTPAALEAISEMSRVEGAVVGAGTVLDPEALDACSAAGARFVVSPGLTVPLAVAAAKHSMPFLSGVATAGEIMRGLDMGLSRFKFFPAVSAGGPSMLRGLAALCKRALLSPRRHHRRDGPGLVGRTLRGVRRWIVAGPARVT